MAGSAQKRKWEDALAELEVLKAKIREVAGLAPEVQSLLDKDLGDVAQVLDKERPRRLTIKNDSSTAGESSLTIFGQVSSDFTTKHDETFVVEWKTGYFDKIVLEYYSTFHASPQYTEIVSLHQDFYPMIGLNVIDEDGQYHGLGEYIGRSNWIHDKIQDFVGQMHVPTQMRQLYFDVNGYTSQTDSVIGTGTADVNDYYFMVGQVVSLPGPDDSSPKSLIIKIEREGLLTTHY